MKNSKIMKHNFFLVGLLFLIGYAQAQYESFFGQQTWSYNEVHPLICYTDDYDPNILSGICCWTQTFSFNKDNRVNINDTIYYKSSDWYFNMLLREDTVNGRLYGRYELDGYDNEYLICDLSLSVGDTFILRSNLMYGHVLCWFSYAESKMRVDSITYPSGRKVIHLTDLTTSHLSLISSYLNHVYNISLRFMEGVGPMYGIRPQNGNEQSGGGVLLCLNKDDEVYYMTHEDLGCYQNGGASVDNYPLSYLEIYPNPVDQYITLNFTSENEVFGTVIIRDMIGRVCKQVDISAKTSVISISDLAKGVYILTFMDEKNRKLTKKIVKS